MKTNSSPDYKMVINRPDLVKNELRNHSNFIMFIDTSEINKVIETDSITSMTCNYFITTEEENLKRVNFRYGVSGIHCVTPDTLSANSFYVIQFKSLFNHENYFNNLKISTEIFNDTTPLKEKIFIKDIKFHFYDLTFKTFPCVSIPGDRQMIYIVNNKKNALIFNFFHTNKSIKKQRLTMDTTIISKIIPSLIDRQKLNTGSVSK